MNTLKISNPVRLIAFFLTSVILICTFGFTVDGWQMGNENATAPPEQDKGDNKNDTPTTVNPTPDNSDKPDSYIPEFINRLTGLEATEEIAKSSTLAFITESDNCYGISHSDILVEIPIENNKTRLISFITDKEELWKIGSITSGRGYISNVVKCFGGIAVQKDNDDRSPYECCDVTTMDLALKNGFYYTEYTSKAYTNRDLITTGLKAYGISDIFDKSVSLPYSFNSFDEDNIKYENAAIDITVSRTDSDRFNLEYNEENRKYTYVEKGVAKTDVLNGKVFEFKNCFILFADSVTYDNSDGSQMVMDTIGSGSGFYITEGSYTAIKWVATDSGVMSFYLATGERLTVNRGNSYICYLKSSKTDSVIFT